MASTTSDQPIPPATLTIGDGEPLKITSEAELRSALVALQSLSSGEKATLQRGPKHYIKATRRGEFWSATTRRGGFWTSASFAAAEGSEWCEWSVRESRRIGSGGW